MVILGYKIHTFQEVSDQLGYVVDRTHPNHRRHLAMECEFFGCRSLYDLEAAATAFASDTPYIEFTGGSSHGANLTPAERRWWIEGFIAALGLKAGFAAAHVSEQERFDYHIVTIGRDQDGRLLDTPELEERMRDCARQLTEELNERRLAQGRHTIGNLTKSRQVYYLSRPEPEVVVEPPVLPAPLPEPSAPLETVVPTPAPHLPVAAPVPAGPPATAGELTTPVAPPSASPPPESPSTETAEVGPIDPPLPPAQTLSQFLQAQAPAFEAAVAASGLSGPRLPLLLKEPRWWFFIWQRERTAAVTLRPMVETAFPQWHRLHDLLAQAWTREETIAAEERRERERREQERRAEQEAAATEKQRQDEGRQKLEAAAQRLMDQLPEHLKTEGPMGLWNSMIQQVQADSGRKRLMLELDPAGDERIRVRPEYIKVGPVMKELQTTLDRIWSQRTKQLISEINHFEVDFQKATVDGRLSRSFLADARWGLYLTTKPDGEIELSERGKKHFGNFAGTITQEIIPTAYRGIANERAPGNSTARDLKSPPSSPSEPQMG